MKKFGMTFILALLLLSASVFSQISFCAAETSKDPVKVAPELFKVLLENKLVRALDFKAAPGAKIPMHVHPHHVVYFLTDTKLRFDYPDGKTEQREFKAGDIMWGEAVEHAGANLSDHAVEILDIEIKGNAPS